jgi:hypothetical protein
MTRFIDTGSGGQCPRLFRNAAVLRGLDFVVATLLAPNKESTVIETLSSATFFPFFLCYDWGGSLKHIPFV